MLLLIKPVLERHKPGDGWELSGWVIRDQEDRDLPDISQEKLTTVLNKVCWNKYGVEIVSCDSKQIFIRMEIGLRKKARIEFTEELKKEFGIQLG